MLKITTLLFFLFVELFSLAAFGDSIVEEFDTITNKDTSTAVWNQELGVIHPTLYIEFIINNGDPISTLPINIGDGRHGAFDSSVISSFQSFASIVSNDITINNLAADYAELNFTSFKLDSSYTLTRNDGLPIIIRSLTTVDINGKINCNGNNGIADNLGGAGGTGRCGGKNGGAGGVGATGTSGDSTVVGLVSGGGPGIFGAGGGGGGGGGGAYTPYSCANNGSTSIGNGGSSGLCTIDNIFSNITGNSGGGGGGGASSASGGGGGAGGGIVIIRAGGNINIAHTGAVLAKGGNGGNTTSAGGGGGGGGGGSISIFSSGILNLTLEPSSEPNIIDVTRGNGGTSTSGGGSGGMGAEGRTWDMGSPFSYTDNSLGSINTESHNSLLWDPGDQPPGVLHIKYTTTPQTIISKSYDTLSDFTTYTSVVPSVINLSTSTVLVEIAASSNSDFSSPTAWVNASTLPINLSPLNNKRYIKFKITLTNSSDATPTKIESITINYNPNTPIPPAPSPTPTPTPSPSPSPGTSTTVLKQDFQFNSGACGTISNQTPPQRKYFVLLSLILLIPIFIALKLRSKTVHAKKKN